MTMWECPGCGGTLTCYCPPRPTKKEEAMTEFDPSKPVMTRGGHPATILTTTRKHRDNIVGLIHRNHGDDVFIFGPDGSVSMDGPSQNDLVNIPESKWMTLYEEGANSGHPLAIWLDSKEQADASARVSIPHRRVAIVERKASGDFITTAVEK